MSALYPFAGLAGVLLWALFRLLRPWMPPLRALGFGVLILAVVALLGHELLFILIAVLAPLGVVLPGLALQDIWLRCRDTAQTRRFSTIELTLFAGLYAGFLAASIGVVSFDPYRVFYDPVAGAVLAFFACGYALWRGHVALAVMVVLGQLAWALGLGSSNFIDHVAHVLLVPVIAVILTKRAFEKMHRNAYSV